MGKIVLSDKNWSPDNLFCILEVLGAILVKFGQFPARKMAAGNSAPPSARVVHQSSESMGVHTIGAEAAIRKSVMSIKFLPVILGPEMAASILWAPGIFWFFLLENPMPIKFLLLGGGWGFLEGGVGVPILFLWAWGFFRCNAVFQRISTRVGLPIEYW